MRSSFITLTFAVACFLGSSLASPVYVERDLRDVGEGVNEPVEDLINDALPDIHLLVHRDASLTSLKDIPNLLHKRGRITRQILQNYSNRLPSQILVKPNSATKRSLPINPLPAADEPAQTAAEASDEASVPSDNPTDPLYIDASINTRLQLD